MSQIKIIVVSGEKIVENKVLDISTTLSDNKYFLLEGFVYQNDMSPLKNAAIKVIRVNHETIPYTLELVGITFSMEDGSYGISLLSQEEYRIIVYS